MQGAGLHGQRSVSSSSVPTDSTTQTQNHTNLGTLRQKSKGRNKSPTRTCFFSSLLQQHSLRTDNSIYIILGIVSTLKTTGSVQENIRHYMQILHHSTQGTRAASDFGILGGRGGWNQLSMNTEGQLPSVSSTVLCSQLSFCSTCPGLLGAGGRSQKHRNTTK